MIYAAAVIAVAIAVILAVAAGCAPKVLAYLEWRYETDKYREDETHLREAIAGGDINWIGFYGERVRIYREKYGKG